MSASPGRRSCRPFSDRALRAHLRSQAPAGSITEAGPGHARRLLVEAAHHYRGPPRIGETLARRTSRPGVRRGSLSRSRRGRPASAAHSRVASLERRSCVLPGCSCTQRPRDRWGAAVSQGRLPRGTRRVRARRRIATTPAGLRRSSRRRCQRWWRRHCARQAISITRGSWPCWTRALEYQSRSGPD